MDETPTSPADEHAAALKALCAAFYCMNDLLESRGCLSPGDLASNLRRLETPSATFNACLAGIVSNLEARNFRPSDRIRPVLLALDGGRKDSPGASEAIPSGAA